MPLRYSEPMRARQTLPAIWLVSDRRNDAVLERVLARLPRGSGFIFRHRHLAEADRANRLRQLQRACRRHGHVLVLAGPAAAAANCAARGCYGGPGALGQRTRGLRLVTAHSLGEIGKAVRAGGDAILLSPVFPTHTHPGARALGVVRFLLLARRSPVPVIALGGMSARSARRLPVRHWAAIDGLMPKSPEIRDS